MPELAEAEIHCRNLNHWSQGRIIEDVERWDPSRFHGAHDLLVSNRIIQWKRRAKYLYTELGDGHILLIHLGMSGNWAEDPGSDVKYARFSFRMSGGPGPRRIALVDRRRLARIWLLQGGELESHPRLKGLGPEPLGPDFHADFLQRRLQRSRAPIKSRLLDQSVGAGVGNIAVLEACFRAGIHPHTPCNQIPAREWGALVVALQDHFRGLLDHPVGKTMAYVSEGTPEPRFQIYGNEGAECPRCGEEIHRCVLAGRPTFWCPSCQPMPQKGA